MRAGKSGHLQIIYLDLTVILHKDFGMGVQYFLYISKKQGNKGLENYRIKRKLNLVMLN